MELSLKEMGAYLKKLRENKRLSTREVYELSKVSNSYLSLVENGHRRASAVVLKKLAPVYGVDYLELYIKAGYADLAEKEKISDHNLATPNKHTHSLKDEISQKYGANSVKLLEDYNKLNTIGKQKANENIEDLTKINEYTEEEETGLYEA